MNPQSAHFQPSSAEINDYCILTVEDGSGYIEIDLRPHHAWKGKTYFLSPGQFLRFIGDGFKTRLERVEASDVKSNAACRVLFRELLSTGYIEKTTPQATGNRLEHYVKSWFSLNPFNASGSEYEVLFDLKESVDNAFANTPLVSEILSRVAYEPIMTRSLCRKKLGLPVKKLIDRKRMSEARKSLVFTDLTVKEVAYRTGYGTPSHFNNKFVQTTGLTPIQYRIQKGDMHASTFSMRVIELIETYHKTRRDIDFYAEKLFLSKQSLSRKTREHMGASPGKLIRSRVLRSACLMLKNGASVTETSRALHFEEVSHFSAFFKKMQGVSPSQFQKVQ